MSAVVRRGAPLLVLAAVVVLARALLIGGFGTSVPFWDQWDGEAALWLKPWVEGELGPGHLFAAHNEHRIAWSRAWSLLWFEANGRIWDNLVLALANTLLSALLGVLLYVQLRTGLATRGARAVLFALVLALATAPFGWENLLVGFQSQFQFLALFALLLFAAAARGDDTPRTIGLLWALALLGLPTMATGVLAPVAAGGVLVLRAWARQWRPRPAAIAVFGLAVIAIGGLAAVPTVPGHEQLRPHGVAEGLRAFGQVLSWPLGRWWLAPVLWLPSLVALYGALRRREASAAEAIALALSAWVALQALAIAWSRGQGLDWPPSRYTDLLAYGLVANAWFGLRGWERSATAAVTRRATAAVIALLCLGAIVGGVARALPADAVALHQRSWLHEEQRTNVREFLASADPRALIAPPQYIPYPDAQRLQQHLSDPTIRAMLPASLGDGPAGPLGAPAARWRERMRPHFHADQPAHPAQAGRWRLPTQDGPQEAFQVVAGVELALEIPAPRTARLASASVQLGTYGQVLPGTLELEACTPAQCVNARSPLAVAQDNKDLVLVFDRPLPLQAGEPLRLRFTARDTGHPVAVWLVPAGSGDSRLHARALDGVRDDLAGHSPRLALGLLP